MSDKIACPYCENRYGNVISHLKNNRACAAALARDPDPANRFVLENRVAP